MQPFGQVQSTYARDHQGTGLGLPIAKGLIELHGGKLVMTSRPGIGTSIRIGLPLSCMAEPPKQPALRRSNPSS
jgi:two-component system, cell cycle sensor histidine kinase DivJ